MKRAGFFLFLFLIIPLPLTQTIVEGFFIDSISDVEDSYSFTIDTSSSNSNQPQIIKIEPSEKRQDSAVSEDNSFPRMSPATYASSTSAVANASIIQKNEVVQATATTEFELLGMFPVDHGDHYWYDLVSILEDGETAAGAISHKQIATQFSIPYDVEFMSFSFNLSQITSLVSNQIDFYLTDNLLNYQTDYLMKYEVTFHNYNFHENNADSPLLFTYYNHPLSIQVDNQLTADQDYFAILESASNFSLQYSNDSSGTDENKVFTFNSGWEEQNNIDMQFSVYSGSLLQTSTVNLSGQTSLFYDSSLVSGRHHRIAITYYDSLNSYDSSSDFCDVEILDSLIPEYLTLTSPPTAEYSDEINIIAKVENLYLQPLSNINVSFYISDDNTSWSFLTSEITNHEGYAIINYLITEASGNLYFKSIAGILEDFSVTDRQKEPIQVQTPRVDCMYGSAIGSASLTLYSLKTKVVDNEGDPIVGLIVQFYMQGLFLPIISATNDSGWAVTPIGFLDWNAGYFANSYWIIISMDTNLYNYPPTTYGDINISQNNISIQAPTEIQGYWNELLDLELQFFDSDGDAVPNLNFEVILYDENTAINTTLGIFQTNSSGYGALSFPAEFFTPGNHLLYIKVNSMNYSLFEQAVPLLLLNDKAIISVNFSNNITYIYNSIIHIEAFVTDHFGNPLEDISVQIFVSMPNYFDFWDEIYTVLTNSSGIASIDILLTLNAGDMLNIQINTADYYQDSVLYYVAADSFISYVTCILAPSSFEELSDISCTNQETIEIAGKLVSNGLPIANELVSLTILGIEYQAYTDVNGYFSLSYFVGQGGFFEVLIEFDSSPNYISTTTTIYLNSAPGQLILTGADIYHTTANPITFVVFFQSNFGTTPEGILVNIFWYDGNSWIFLDAVLTNSSGYIELTSAFAFPLGEWLWKAEVNGTSDWQSASNQWILKIGVNTIINVTSQTEAEYLSTIEIIAEVKDEYNQPIFVEVKFYLNGSYLGSALSNTSGIAVFQWQVNFVPGEYIITGEILQSGMYLSSSDTWSLTINKTNSFLTCEDIFTYYSQLVSVPINLYSTIGGIINAYLTIQIPGLPDELILTNMGGIAMWTIPLLQPGIYEIAIIFNGDSFYYPSSLIINLQVDKMPTTISLGAQNQIYTPTYLVSGYLQDQILQPLEGVTISLIVNGTIIQTTQTNEFGYYEFTISLEPGTYLLEVLYQGDVNYLTALATKTVHIWKIDTTIQGTVTWQDLTLILEAQLNDSNDISLENMIVKFYLNGTLEGQNITDSLGYTSLSIDSVIPGIYEIEIVFEGNSIYKQSSQIIVLEQQKMQTELVVNIFEGIYATIATNIEIRLTSNNQPLENKNIVLRINGQELYGLTNSSGYVLVALDLLYNSGFYSLEVLFLGDIVYSAINLNDSFTISKAESTIDLIFYYENYQPWLSGTLEGPTILATEIVNIYVNGSYLTTLVTDDLGAFLAQIGLIAGNYLISVTYGGNANYLGTSTSIEATIFKTPTQIVCNESFNQTYGIEYVLDIQLLDVLSNPIQADLIITLDGNYFDTITTDALGYVVLTLNSDIGVGLHQLVITYQGSAVNYQTSKNIIFYTKFYIDLIDLVSVPESYGQEGSISGQISTFGGLLHNVDMILIINGQNILTQTDSGGHFVFLLDPFLEAGTYLVVIRVNENDIVLYYEYTFWIDREKGLLDIVVNPLDKVFNQDTSVQGSVTFQGTQISNALVYVYINGVNLGTLISDQNGNFIIPVGWLQLSPGKYNLTIFVALNDLNIKDSSIEFEFESLRDNLDIEIAWTNNEVEKFLVLIMSFVDSNGLRISNPMFSVFANGTEILESSEENGFTTLFYYIEQGSLLEITIYLAQTGFYYSFQTIVEIPVIKCNSQIIKSDNVVYYNSSTGVIVFLHSENNKPIANALLLVSIDSDKYLYQTDSEGRIAIDITGYAVGNYSVDIIYEESESYNESKLKFKLEIEQQVTLIEIATVEGMIFLYLKDNENRSLSNENVTIKYIGEDGEISREERYTTDEYGRVILELSLKELIKEVNLLRIIFDGGGAYVGCMKTISLQDLIDLGKSILSSNYRLSIPLSLLGLAGIVGLAFFIKRIFRQRRKSSFKA